MFNDRTRQAHAVVALVYGCRKGHSRWRYGPGDDVDSGVISPSAEMTPVFVAACGGVSCRLWSSPDAEIQDSKTIQTSKRYHSDRGALR